MPRRDRRVAARTKAVTPPQAAGSRCAGQRRGAAPARPEPPGDGTLPAEVIPLGDLRPVQRKQTSAGDHASLVSGRARGPADHAGRLAAASPATCPRCPELLPEAGLGRPARTISGLAYDEDRLDHHSRLAGGRRPRRSGKVITEGRRLSVPEPRMPISGRCGLIVSGQPGTGKTTAVTQLGKTDRGHAPASRHPGSGGDIPVIYITAPPAATAQMIAVEFARFLGLPVARRPTSPTSPRQSAAYAWTRAPAWSASILPTATTAVLDVRPACVPGRSVIIYRLGSGRPPCSQVSRRRACGSAGCDKSAEGSEADEEGRAAVMDGRLYRPLAQLFLMSVRLAFRDVP